MVYEREMRYVIAGVLQSVPTPVVTLPHASWLLVQNVLPEHAATIASSGRLELSAELPHKNVTSQNIAQVIPTNVLKMITGRMGSRVALMLGIALTVSVQHSQISVQLLGVSLPGLGTRMQYPKNAHTKIVCFISSI